MELNWINKEPNVYFTELKGGIDLLIFKDKNNWLFSSITMGLSKVNLKTKDFKTAEIKMLEIITNHLEKVINIQKWLLKTYGKEAQ